MTQPEDQPEGSFHPKEPEPTSRWARKRSGRDVSARVRISHAQTRSTIRLALVLIVVSALTAAIVDDRWLAVHLFLAGGVMLAISGVSVMLTVTWSAAPAPPDALMAIQRICIAVGAVGVGVGRHFEVWDTFIGVTALLYLLGLGLLAYALVDAAQHGTKRRFDPAVVAYLVAISCGVTGVVIGAWMAIDQVSTGLRSAHTTTNLLGLIGLVVGGTMPYFAATVGRSKMAPHATRIRLFGVQGWQTLALLIATLALITHNDPVAGSGFMLYSIGVVFVLYLLPRPTKRQLQWAGPRVIALWLGGLWWIATVALTAVDAWRGEPVFSNQWVAVLAISGYGQILWGSLAYLLPMLRGGGHERLAEGFATTRSWFGLLTVNAAGISLALQLPGVVSLILIGVWLLDSAWRALQIGTSQADRPPQHT